MADIDDDDEFGSDDGFDDFDALQQLEQQAWLSTQQQKKTVPIYGTNIGQFRQGLAQRTAWQPRQEESFESDKTLQPNQPNRPNQTNSDYGFEDEDIIDLDQDPYTKQQPYNQQPSAFAGRLEREAQIQHQHDLSANAYGTPRAAPPMDQVNVAEMQARILQLENDRLTLQKQVEEARGTAQSKAGEAAILRQKAEKAAKDYEQKVSTLRQLHAEEYAKQKAELQRIKSEREKVVTDNRFLEHDLALEAGKNRQIQKTLKTGQLEHAKSVQKGSPATTPKRAKILPYRDGFDDGDLVMLSPSKTRDRTKPGTPKVGAKRKRNANNDTQSPIAPLQLPLSEPKPPPVPPQPQVEAKVASDLVVRLSKEQNKLRFMQNLLRHHILDSEENVFEALTQFTFPSAPGTKLSGLVYEQLSPITSAGRNVPEQFCSILLSLWEQSLAEKFYQPLPCIIDSIQSIMDAERFIFARKVIERVVPLAIATSDLVAIPVARASLNKNQSPRPPATATTTTSNPTFGNPESHIEAAGAAYCIDVLACLTLLRTLAEAAAPSADSIRLFWQQMKFDFVLLVLMKAQPMEQIGLMLELLQGSALEESFGAILGEKEGGRGRQAMREVDTVDRLTLLLSENFDFSDDGNDNREEAINLTCVFELRAKAVDVLMALCLRDHGTLLLATHRHAIGRMFKFLHESINNLYLYTHPTDHGPLTRSINNTMKILYLLCSTSTNLNIDVRQKLSILPGGMHVHLLALTRLAFAERIWYEKGIEEGAVERAHEMLDEWLSPEEGEGLMMMFGSSGSGDGEM